MGFIGLMTITILGGKKISISDISADIIFIMSAEFGLQISDKCDKDT